MAQHKNQGSVRLSLERFRVIMSAAMVADAMLTEIDRLPEHERPFVKPSWRDAVYEYRRVGDDAGRDGR